MKRYNLYIDQTGQPHKLKREITTNFLKAIELHHHQMHIHPGHNSSYREKITLATVQQTLQVGENAQDN